mmetsp:Transcript_750/g.1533  ORF Transcript_750/g.1533 Transcript_750/m.1533 type:complete len:82 (+) Transcript_750:582-827(+)
MLTTSLASGSMAQYECQKCHAASLFSLWASTRKRYNGMQGILGDWCTESKRFQVLLPCGEVKLIRPANLGSPESSDSDDSE